MDTQDVGEWLKAFPFKKSNFPDLCFWMAGVLRVVSTHCDDCSPLFPTSFKVAGFCSFDLRFEYTVLGDRGFLQTNPSGPP
jgi:hypothetical protein